MKKTGSLTQAAHNTHVTLSAISQSISSLESELGIILFTRSRGSGAIPTAEGKSIISKANEVLIKINELREEAQSYSSTLSGKLKIATSPGPMHLLVDVVSEFKKDFPNVKIEILEKGPKEILDDIQHSKIDIGLIVLSGKLMEKRLLRKIFNVHTPRLAEKRRPSRRLDGRVQRTGFSFRRWDDEKNLLKQLAVTLVFTGSSHFKHELNGSSSNRQTKKEKTSSWVLPHSS